MRKKIMSFIMAGTMVCVTLTGCGLTNSIVEQTQQEIDEAKENLQEEAKDLSGDIDELNESLSSAGEDISKIVNDTINGTSEEDDQMKADEVADLIDAIYVQMHSARQPKKRGMHLRMHRRNSLKAKMQIPIISEEIQAMLQRMMQETLMKSGRMKSL